MGAKKALLSAAAVLLMVFSAAITYYLVKADFNATGVFWDGAVTGTLGCLFLASSALSILQVTGHAVAAKRHRLIYWVIIMSGLATAILFYFKPGDSDVWWYGAIAGFLGSLSLVFFTIAVALISELRHKN